MKLQPEIDIDLSRIAYLAGKRAGLEEAAKVYKACVKAADAMRSRCTQTGTGGSEIIAFDAARAELDRLIGEFK